MQYTYPWVLLLFPSSVFPLSIFNKQKRSLELTRLGSMIGRFEATTGHQLRNPPVEYPIRLCSRCLDTVCCNPYGCVSVGSGGFVPGFL
jgi:hypothetical protein